MNKQSFNKENVTELLSQLKKVVNRDLGDEYNQELIELSRKIDRNFKKRKLVMRVASNFLKTILATMAYSTHGKWSPSKEIYKTEKERGNKVDKLLLQENYDAIWVCPKPEDCVRYNRSSDEEDDPVTQEEIDELVKVNLSGATHVKSMDDGDGGELWIRKAK